MRKTKHRGIGRVAANFLLNLIAYNLIRIPKLTAARSSARAAIPRSGKQICLKPVHTAPKNQIDGTTNKETQISSFFSKLLE